MKLAAFECLLTIVLLHNSTSKRDFVVYVKPRALSSENASKAAQLPEVLRVLRISSLQTHLFCNRNVGSASILSATRCRCTSLLFLRAKLDYLK